jgi:hypothetical protein
MSYGRKGIQSHWRNYYRSGQKQLDLRDIAEFAHILPKALAWLFYLM